MKDLLNLTSGEAKSHFLKGSSYFNGDLPSYITFEPILRAVAEVLGNAGFQSHQGELKPHQLSGVNYSLLSNKDGRFGWRPIELIHPAIYVSLVNLICEESNWVALQNRFSAFSEGAVDCCSIPVIATDHERDQAAQVTSWWQKVEQKSMALSLDYSHTLHTDVTDCYGSLYTHSIPWALHGLEVSKQKPKDKELFGNSIDWMIQASRYGQTNGISQGSVLMDFIAELVLGYVDEEISKECGCATDFRILRYRDDYRIFTNSDQRSEEILKIISDKLRAVGMRLGVGKTFMSTNVIEGSVKPDKLAAIQLQELDTQNAATLQKELLRLHAFGRRYPNSGALRRLLGDLHKEIVSQSAAPDDLEVQVAIAADVAYASPSTFPAVAGILSHLISLGDPTERASLWNSVRRKIQRMPYNGYLEIWLQRVVLPSAHESAFVSNEPICKLVAGLETELWNNNWIASQKLKEALDIKSIVVADPISLPAVVQPEEVKLFREKAENY